jgi:hypothetical protein
MTRDELRDLKVGDRVRWSKPGDECDGTVAEKKYGFAHITWDDGAKVMVIGWRSKDDRARGKNITKLAEAETL